MKNIKYILILFVTSFLLYSCDTNDEISGYNPDSSTFNYVVPTSDDYSISIDPTSVTAVGFEVSVTANMAGEAYYIVTSADAQAPTSKQVYDSGTKLDLSANVAVVFNVSQPSLYGKTVKVYTTFMDLTDNLLTENVNTLSQNLSGCTVPISGEYSAVSSIGGSPVSAFDVNMVPTGNKNEFMLASTWGPNFIADATGNPGFAGILPYPSILKINDDLSVTVTGDSEDAPGGTGTYTVCDNIITVNLNQSIFTDPFIVTVTFSPR